MEIISYQCCFFLFFCTSFIQSHVREVHHTNTNMISKTTKNVSEINFVRVFFLIFFVVVVVVAKDGRVLPF